MDAAQRREAILRRLEGEAQPVSATALARRFAVSRQIIVGDVALLRAGGAGITATPRGYVLSRQAGGLIRTVACAHPGASMARELEIMVDNGCTVLDVVVEHPVYGQLTGSLQISSRYDIAQFLRRVESSRARPLSDLTGGIHLHTLSCPDENAYQRVCSALRELGILLED